MAEPIKPTAPAFTFDEGKVKAKIKELHDYMQTFAGKAGYNPYLWLQKNLVKLEEQYNDGVRTEALQLAILSIKSAEPTAKGAEHNVTHPPKEHAAAGNSSNAGQLHMAQGTGQVQQKIS